MIQTLELADKGFKTAMLGMLKNTEEKVEETEGKMESFTRELKSIFKKN